MRYRDQFVDRETRTPQPDENAGISRDTPSSLSAEEITRAAFSSWIEQRKATAMSEERKAYDYLRRVFEICAPQCEALPDLMGLCTQIDNLIAGYRIALEKIGESEERTSDE